MNDFDELSPEMIQKLIELGVLDEESAGLADDKYLAYKRRYGQGPEGRDSGRVYTAANPFEHVAHAWQGIQAGKELDALKQRQGDIRGQQTEGRGAFGNLVLDQLRQKRKLRGYDPHDPASALDAAGGSY